MKATVTYGNEFFTEKVKVEGADLKEVLKNMSKEVKPLWTMVEFPDGRSAKRLTMTYRKKGADLSFHECMVSKEAVDFEEASHSLNKFMRHQPASWKGGKS